MNTRPPSAPEGSTTERLVDQIRARHAVGLRKYGVTLDRRDLTTRQWIQHHREELLDALGYLQRIEDELVAPHRPEPASMRLTPDTIAAAAVWLACVAGVAIALVQAIK